MHFHLYTDEGAAPPTKFFRLKLDIFTKLPVNNFSFARDNSRAIFCFQNLDKKDFDVI